MNVFKEGKNLFFASVTSFGSRSVNFSFLFVQVVGFLVIFRNHQPEEIGRYWSAFVLYCVPRLSTGEAQESQKEGRITLCQILRACDLAYVFPAFSLVSVLLSLWSIYNAFMVFNVELWISSTNCRCFLSRQAVF